jgi:hypothetical protein
MSVRQIWPSGHSMVAPAHVHRPLVVAGLVPQLVVTATLSHVRPTAQVWPQPPQFFSSAAMSTQVPPQQRSASVAPHWVPLAFVDATHSLAMHLTVAHGLALGQSGSLTHASGGASGAASIAASAGTLVSTTIVPEPPQNPAMHR